MAQVDWHSIMNGNSQPKKRYSGANVKFFIATNENREKSLLAGRAVFDEIPSISIQYPGGDETVRKIEPQDVTDYPELYAAFTAGNQPVESGLPLHEWTPITASALKELNYLGFRTVEQLAEANDDVKRRMGPLSKFVKLAIEWIGATNSTQNQVVALQQQLERERSRTAKLEEQVELLMQRIEATEGINLNTKRREVIQSVRSVEVMPEVDSYEEEEAVEEMVVEAAPVKRRGRPRKV